MVPNGRECVQMQIMPRAGTKSRSNRRPLRWERSKIRNRSSKLSEGRRSCTWRLPSFQFIIPCLIAGIKGFVWSQSRQSCNAGEFQELSASLGISALQSIHCISSPLCIWCIGCTIVFKRFDELVHIHSTHAHFDVCSFLIGTSAPISESEILLPLRTFFKRRTSERPALWHSSGD